MLPRFNKIKGIHPGVILKRELRKRKLKGIELANSIGEFPQTINAITKERRGINPKLSIKLGEYFGVSNDYFMILQASYEVGVANELNNIKIDPPKDVFRKMIFWDTEYEKIDWIKNKRAIIRRVFERGSSSEITELVKFYGIDNIRKEIEKIKDTLTPAFNENVSAYIIGQKTHR